MSQVSERSLGVEERPLRADARRNRERVIAAARAVFAEQGREAQVDDVARRAEVGVGTVYRHFPTKEALLRALAEDAFQRISDEAATALEMADPWEAFVYIVERGAQVMAGDRALTEVVMEVPGAMQAAAGAQAELRDRVDEVLRRAQQAGVLRPDLVGDDMGMLMCGIGSATMKPHQCNDAWRRHVAIVLDGLRATSASGELPT
jgi:AcrR family transcriptional regulator